MAYENLKLAIRNAIKQNGNNEITGDVLQEILLSMVNALGDPIINGTGSFSFIQDGPSSPNVASGSSAGACGFASEASANESFALGYRAKATGQGAFAVGYYATASGIASHAEGRGNQLGTTGVASGEASHVEGRYCNASALASHAEGNSTKASAQYSHAEGSSTESGGDASHAEGGYTSTQNLNEHAEGRYNESHKASTVFGNAGNTLSSAGFGTSANRRNAYEIMQNGDLYVYGVGRYNGKNPGSTGVRTVQALLEQFRTAWGEFTPQITFIGLDIEEHTRAAMLTLLDLTANDWSKIITGHCFSIADADSDTVWGFAGLDANFGDDIYVYYKKDTQTMIVHDWEESGTRMAQITYRQN